MSNGDPLVGHVLDGRYEILRKLARGGMATVYLASDRRLTRTVAVKVMHDNLGGDAEFVARFDREARAAARLSHPNVVAVFDQGMDAGRPYIVMEYVEGCTLRHVITREAPMEPTRALDLLVPVVAAVAAAHEAGIIHRDIKPENVLISDRGQIKVADFGLARAVTAHTATQTGTLIGTVSYIAPELVTTGKGDTRADVYALGVVLFEMLTGRKPHTGDTPIQVAYAHVHNEIPAPSSQMTPSWRDSRGGIPPYLDALVTSATTRDKGARPADATVFLDHARRARRALADGVMDDPALSAAMRVSTLDASNSPTEQVPALVATGNGQTGTIQRTATLRFAPSTPVSPGHPPVADGMPYYDDLPEPASPSVRQLKQRQARRRRRGLLTLLAVLVLTAALAVGGWWVFQGRFMETPAFASLSQEAAEALATERGLQISFDNDFSETVPIGQVVRTNPVEGAPILRGGAVVAYLSKGPERYEMPSVLGMTPDNAQAALEDSHLALGAVENAYHDTAEAGTVFDTSVEVGERVKPGTKVDLSVSKGPAPVEIVDFKGKPFEEAKAHYTDAGLKVEVAEEKNHKSIPAGSVISSSPSKGELPRGGTITFVVSKGPVMVKVPYVKYMGVDEATKVLKKEGFKVKVAHIANFLGLVAYTDPGNGKEAPEGSTVTIYVT
ncbi:MAG: Stk1 family PASTA domain-containing Ser/Thr kinase [Propionicimonas sp.]|nr:Stk1 family PASTA domain-containing Ser/Thr kinase [Propionicimonas sp.]